MRRFLRHTVLVGVLLASLLPATAIAEAPSYALAGRVKTDAVPLAGARVYAYQISELSLQRVDTDTVGAFLFDELPAGLYKIIAVKTGFVPAVVLLERYSADTRQYLEVDLAPTSAVSDASEGDFWSLRRQIPADVLRDLETLEPAADGESELIPEHDGSETFELARTEFRAMSGTDDRFGGPGQMNRGQLSLSGSVGLAEFDLTGDYWTANVARQDASHSTEIALEVASPAGGSVRLLTSDNKIGGESDIDLERYQLSWSRDLGPGSSEVRAEVIEERNFFTAGSIHPMGVPTASRSWNVEGRYGDITTGSATLEAGFRYRQVEDENDAQVASLLPSQRIDLFGLGRMEIHPQVYVQYGLYSTLRDGSLSLSPQGGVVVELGSNWRASTLASHKVHRDDTESFDFAPLQHSVTNSGCQGESHCYRFELEREFDEQSALAIGAMHRRFDETLRLYFSDDFFSHLESLYLVEGDTLPEVQVAMSRRLSPRILARLESSLAAGGGGVFYATDESSYENNVRYLVTSLDTQFERTDTGVFLAFHHLEQQFEPTESLARYPSADQPITDIEMQRLQLMLTQDLRALNLATLAFRLNMEVSRGAGLIDQGSLDDEELYKRVMGGVAVTF